MYELVQVGDETRQCPMCQRILGPNTSLQRHIAAVHLKIKNHECPVCQRRFFRKTDCDKHKTRHLNKGKTVFQSQKESNLRLSEKLKEKLNEKRNETVKEKLTEKLNRSG